jgi:hypothetical protein
VRLSADDLIDFGIAEDALGDAAYVAGALDVARSLYQSASIAFKAAAAALREADA